MAYYFGAGELMVVTSTGSVVAGTLQDVSLDIGFNTVTLHGSKQFPVAVARGPAQVKGRAKSAEVQGAMIGSVLGTAATDGPNTLSSADMGTGAVVAIRWRGSYGGKTVIYTLHSAVLSKYNFAVKNDNFYSSDIEFEAFASETAVKGSFGPYSATGFNTVLEMHTAGVAGNLYTVALVGDSGSGVTVAVNTSAHTIVIHYQPGVSTVGDVEAAIGALSAGNDVVGVKVAGTSARVLTAGMAFTASPVAGGADSNGVLTYSIA